MTYSRSLSSVLLSDTARCSGSYTFTLPAADLQSVISPRTSVFLFCFVFKWKMVFRGHDLDTRCSDCYWDVIAPRRLSVDKAREYMYMYAVYLRSHTHTHLHLCLFLSLYVENHVFTLTLPSPIQLHKVHCNFHTFQVCNSLL